jgi:hypothetical protein
MPDNWELISRHGNYGWVDTFLAVLIGGCCDPNSITLTVREKATHVVRKVTAFNEAQAVARLATGRFDSD